MLEPVVNMPLAAEEQPHPNGAEVSLGTRMNLPAQTTTLLDQLQGCIRQVATLDARLRELTSRVDIMDARMRAQAQATDHLTELCNRLERAVRLPNGWQDSQDRTN